MAGQIGTDFGNLEFSPFLSTSSNGWAAGHWGCDSEDQRCRGNLAAAAQRYHGGPTFVFHLFPKMIT